MTDEPWRATPDGVVVVCRVTPKGGRDAIEGTERRSDGRPVLVVRVREPPEDGRANAALCALLARALDVPPSRVRIAAGGKSRLKHAAVSGEPGALLSRLKALLQVAAAHCVCREKGVR